MSKHGPVWHLLLDPLYRSRVVFAIPMLVAIVFATILGVAGGWRGILVGLLLGLSLEIPLAARDLLVRRLTKGGRSDN